MPPRKRTQSSAGRKVTLFPHLKLACFAPNSPGVFVWKRVCASSAAAGFLFFSRVMILLSSLFLVCSDFSCYECGGGMCVGRGSAGIPTPLAHLALAPPPATHAEGDVWFVKHSALRAVPAILPRSGCDAPSRCSLGGKESR